MSGKHVFGPVASRRLGRSLGVDPVPLKTCNWNCVYCQLGRTSPVTDERREYVSIDDLLTELREALDRLGDGGVDWVTIVGSGEPTLHSRLGELLSGVKAESASPVAVITNGALFYRPEVRADLLAADAVLPSLDAGTAELYRRVNRGHPELTFERLVDGLVRFRPAYHGKLWLEVMLVAGLNDGEAALRDLAAVVRRIEPDEVHLNVPNRPPAEPWVEPPDHEGMMRARAILGDVACVVAPVPVDPDLDGDADPIEAIVGIVTRHPLAADDLAAAVTRRFGARASEILETLRLSRRAKLVHRHGVAFWTASPTIHPQRPARGRG